MKGEEGESRKRSATKYLDFWVRERVREREGEGGLREE